MHGVNGYDFWKLVLLNSAIIIIFAFSTLVLFPILVIVYRRLARFEEQQAIAKFGDEYLSYMERTPAFIPRIHVKRSNHNVITQ